MMVAKAFRRRGKKLVPRAHIALTNDHGELFRAVVERHTPFRSTSTDVGQVWGRCNCDFQFMPRALDPMILRGDSAAQPSAPDVHPKVALIMHGVTLRLPTEPLLRRAFHSIVAMYQAAHNCDYYITKYQGKPLPQMQSLLGCIALGLKRSEEEEASNAAATDSSNAVAVQASTQERARKIHSKVTSAGNRCYWLSAR